MRWIAAAAISISLVGCGGEASQETAPGTSQPLASQEAAAPEPEQVPEPESGLTGPQMNARRSADNYLNMKGFSREGLVQQLSSSAGDGYAEADAIAAVDTLDVDWNEQAARSAKDYLNMMGFSCSGLIEQLSSSAGDKFTEAEARYGAQKAGAC